MNNATNNQTVQAAVMHEINKDEITKGIDAAKVIAYKVNLDSPRWEVTDTPTDQGGTGLHTTPSLLIFSATCVSDTEKKLNNERGMLAAHLFNIAKECKDIFEFEAFMIQLKHEAGWTTYPERVRNYKSRIITHFKVVTIGDTGVNVPDPGDEILLPVLDKKGKALSGGETETRAFRSMGEYYDYCQDLKTTSKPKPATTAIPPVPAVTETPEQMAQKIIDATTGGDEAAEAAGVQSPPVVSSGGVEVTPTATVITEPDGTSHKEEEADPFTMILAELQVLYAQADINEKQRMVKRSKSLVIAIRDSQDKRFEAEDKATA